MTSERNCLPSFMHRKGAEGWEGWDLLLEELLGADTGPCTLQFMNCLDEMVLKNIGASTCHGEQYHAMSITGYRRLHLGGGHLI